MKITDVKEVKSLDRAFLVTTWQRSTDTRVLHITDTEGKAKRDHVYITRCHHVLINHEVQNRLAVIDPDDWKLCPRCGTLKDFQAVHTALKTFWNSWHEKDRLKQAERERGYMWDDVAITIDRMIREEASTTPEQVVQITVGELLAIMQEE